MLKITFNRSSSKNYPRALVIASQFKSFSPAGAFQPNTITLEDHEIPDNLDRLYSFLALTDKWTHLKFDFNGKSVEPYPFYLLQRRISDCSKECSRAINKDKHCWQSDYYDGWGCKFIDGIFRHLKGNAFYRTNKYWYNFGHFTDENTWQLDKDEILEKLTREIEKKNLQSCPHFCMKTVEGRIDSLPDKIDLNSRYWDKFYRQEIGPGGSPTKVPINIRHISTDFPLTTSGKLEVLIAEITWDGDCLPENIRLNLPPGIRKENRDISLN